MIVIAGTIPINPDRRDEAIQVAMKMAEASQQEEGCNAYQFYADFADPNTFLIFEEWASEAALQAHFQTPHMAEFQKQIPQYVAGPLNLKRYEVSQAKAL